MLQMIWVSRSLCQKAEGRRDDNSWREFTTLLSAPLADRQMIEAFRAAQADLLRDEELLKLFNRVLAFVVAFQRDAREQRARAGISALASVINRKADVMGDIMILQDYNRSVSGIDELYKKVAAIKQNHEEYSEIIQLLIDELDKAFQAANTEAQRHQIRPVEKRAWLVGPKRLDSVEATVDGRRSHPDGFDYTPNLVAAEAISALGSIFLELYHQFAASEKSAGYWIKVLTQLTEINKRCSEVMSKAEFSDDGSMEVHGLTSPLVAKPKLEKGATAKAPAQEWVPHEVLKMSPEERVLVITGANGAGKTTFLRSLALLYVFNQLGSDVFGKNVKLPQAGKILTYQPAEDKGGEGFGKFAGECQRLSALCNEAGQDTVVFLDEMLSSMSQLPIVGEFAKKIVERFKANGARVFLVTHNPHIVKALADDASCKFLAGKQDHSFEERAGSDDDMADYIKNATRIFEEHFASPKVVA